MKILWSALDVTREGLPACSVAHVSCPVAVTDVSGVVSFARGGASLENPLAAA